MAIYRVERIFSDKKNEMKTGDKVGIWAHKHLATKGLRKGTIEGYGEGKWHKLSKESAKIAAGLGGGLGAIVGGATGGVKGAIKGGAIGAGAYGAGTYVGTRVSGAIQNVANKHSRSNSERSALIADRARVANGDMSKEKYLKKHNR